MAHFKAFLGSHQDLGPKTAVPVLGIRPRPRSELKTLDTLPMTRPRKSCASLSSLYISPRARTGEGLRRSKDQGGVIEGAEGGEPGYKRNSQRMQCMVVSRFINIFSAALRPH